MVRLNNQLDGTNTPVVDAYLRNLGEYRAAVENSILPIISFFVDKTESSQGTFVLPASIFEDQRRYIERLAQRYHKRDFDFRVDPEERQDIYDVIAQMIGHNRKAVGYSLCDFMDFERKFPDMFGDVVITHNLAMAIREETAEFNHLPSDRLERMIKEAETQEAKEGDAKNDFSPPALPTFTKFVTPQHLYAFMLSELKRAVDFEFLKLYDFLLEFPGTIVRSNKLVGVLPDLRERGEAEYSKRPFRAKVTPHRYNDHRSVEDVFIDEWAANIARGLTAQNASAKGFVDYLYTPEGQQLRALYLSGVFPELISLVHHFHQGRVPKELQID